MDEPTITPVRRSLVFRWPEGPIAKVMRIREERGQIQAEVAIGLQELGQVLHLREAHFNLSSERTRVSWTKELHNMAVGLDWHTVIETICVKSIRHFRNGRPAVWLDQVSYPARIPPRLAPLLYQRQPTILFGDGGSAKSTIALAIALSVASGERLLGWEPVPTTVFYLDWESDEETMARRLEHLKKGLGINGSVPIRYKRMYGLLSEQIDQIAEELAETECGLIIIDAMGKATANAPEAASEALTFFDALDSLEIDYLVIDHIDKATLARGDADRPYGSVFKYTAARAVWFAKKYGEPGDEELYVRIQQTKANDMTRHLPIALRIEFSEDATYIHSADWDKMPEELQAKQGQKELVLDALDAAMTFSQLVEFTEIKPASLKKVLNRLRKQNLIDLSGEQWKKV